MADVDNIIVLEDRRRSGEDDAEQAGKAEAVGEED